MEKIRILQSVGSLGMGGNEIFVMNLFRNIDKDKFQVDFAVYDDNRLEFYDEVIKAGSQVYFCNSRFKNKFLRFIDEVKNTKQVLKNTNYDIIHCHSCSLLGLLRGAIPGYLARDTKVITHSHNTGLKHNAFLINFTYCILKRLLCSIVDYGFSCSDVAGQSKYTERLMNSPKYHIIRNAVSIDKYSFSQLNRKNVRDALELEENVFVIGNVGRFEKQKNHTFLLEIFFEILKKNENSKLLLVGDGSLWEEMHQKSLSMGIAEAVLFLGHQDSAAPYYQAMDCFVMPSLYEGFPFVLIEAQTNGLKCIVSDTITKSVNISGGVCFESLADSAEQWANVILNSGSKRLHASQVESVHAQYDLKEETRRVENLYRSVIKC